MRISDWSSDVCSSDLCGAAHLWHRFFSGLEQFQEIRRIRGHSDPQLQGARSFYRQQGVETVRRNPQGASRRSEEHTSELQSLMRISYAVFCLKKKNKHTTIKNDHTSNERTHTR